jgi:GDP-mannose 6-dehydrogenase
MGLPTSQQDIHISVIGLGYVGCVTAACFSQLGYRVTGVDRDEYKIQKVQAGEAPFFEPGLEEAVSSAVQAGRLQATTSTETALRDCDIALLCVGTPSERNGNLGLDQLRRVVREIHEHLPRRSGKPLVVAVRSTVFPGTCEEIVEPEMQGFPNVDVVSNPEFLREGTAMQDFIEPALVVVGGSNIAAVRKVADLYASLQHVDPCLVSLRTAEMIKYACNAFHAVKICFANEIGALSERLGVDGHEVMRTFCRDTRLNISPAYLRPGFSFGGSCLPKDLRALVYRASRLDIELPLLASAMPSNNAHLKRAIDMVLSSGSRRLGVMGLTFKENTDDLRESPVITMLEFLIGKGLDLRIYDPNICVDSIYGSNREFLLNAIPHIGRLLVSSPQAVMSWADTLVVTQKPTAAVLDAIGQSGLPVIDVAGVLANRKTPATVEASV